MRRASILAVLVLAACGAETETTRIAGAADRPAGPRPAAWSIGTVTSRIARARSDSPPDDAAEWPPPDSRDPDDPPPPPVSRVTGRVIDTAGAPVPHATVVAFLGGEHVEGRADDDGAFDLGVDEPTGVVRCLASGEGRAVAVGKWVALREGEFADAGTIVCGPVARIEGRIVLPDGTKTCGTVSVDWTDAFDEETWALVRRCGPLDPVVAQYTCPGPQDFAISCLPPGRYRLHANDDGAPRTVTAPAADVELPAPPEPGVTTVDVDVRVTEFDGMPVTDFTAEVRPRGDGQFVEGEWVERDGARVLRATYDGTAGVAVEVTASDGRTARRGLDPGDKGAVEIRFPRVRPDGPRLAIHGRVTSDGRPLTWSRRSGRGYSSIVGTRVEVFAFRDGDQEPCARAETAHDGSFVLEDLDEGAYCLWAAPDPVPPWSESWSLATARAAANAGDDDVTIDAPVASSRRFRLVLPDGLGTIADHECSIAGPAGERDAVEAELVNGTIVATGLRVDVPYSLSIRVRCGRTWTATSHVAWFVAGDETLEIRVARGLRIEGAVLRADGTPVVGAEVYASTPDGGHADAYAGLDGAFVLTGLDTGRWTLRGCAPGLADDESVADAGATGVRIVMQSER
jgi:hypothetical protein